MDHTMKKLVPVLLLAALLPLGGCLCAPAAPYAPYGEVNGPWTNYDPYYEYGYYRSTSQPLAYYGPYDAPYGHTRYNSYSYGY
jgi:hypothetical protein